MKRRSKRGTWGTCWTWWTCVTTSEVNEGTREYGNKGNSFSTALWICKSFAPKERSPESLLPESLLPSRQLSSPLPPLFSPPSPLTHPPAHLVHLLTCPPAHLLTCTPAQLPSSLSHYRLQKQIPSFLFLINRPSNRRSVSSQILDTKYQPYHIRQPHKTHRHTDTPDTRHHES